LPKGSEPDDGVPSGGAEPEPGQPTPALRGRRPGPHERGQLRQYAPPLCRQIWSVFQIGADWLVFTLGYRSVVESTIEIE